MFILLKLLVNPSYFIVVIIILQSSVTLRRACAVGRIVRQQMTLTGYRVVVLPLPRALVHHSITLRAID